MVPSRVAVALPLLLLAAARAPAQEPGHAATWRTLTFVQGSSTQATTTFVARDDGAIVIGGAPAEVESYTLQLAGLPAKPTALRIESLPDPSLAHGGNARHHQNFVLSDVEAALGTRSSRRPRALALRAPSASFAQEGFPAINALDGAPRTGWAISPRFGQAHHFVVELDKEPAASPDDLLTLVLHCQFGDRHLPGCLRISATDAPPPVRAEQEADERSWGEVQARIGPAIDRGCDWLLSQQLLDGSWDLDQTGYRNGGTALVLYALLKSGVHKSHPAVVRALAWLECHAPVETYTLGCQMMAVAALNDPAREGWMRAMLDALLRNQLHTGQFRYHPGAGGSDLSNTQYGVLGMRAAAQAGVRVPQEAWEKAAQFTLSVVDDAGGGAYAPLGFRYNADVQATGSMTAAGASILAICDEQLKVRTRLGSLSAAARRGAEWLGKHFAVDANPHGEAQWTYYYLYGVERLGALLQQEAFGGHRWYREGARWLVDKQEGSGAWPAMGAGALGSTSWALLFLTRATASSTGTTTRATRSFGGDDPAQPISLRASGDDPLTFWISSWGAGELEAYEWPGEAGRGLRVKRIEWWAIGMPGAEEPALIAQRDERGDQPCGHERFGSKFQFPLPGTYSLYVRATLLAPPASPAEPAAAPAAPSHAGSGAAAPHEVVVESPPLDVTIQAVMDPVLLGYAGDPKKNLLALQKPGVRASSHHDDWWQPARALDGLVTRAWACNDDDRAARLTVELEKPVRGNVVLLTPARLGTDRPWPARVRVTVNGKGAPIEAALEVPRGERPDRKTRIVLGPPQVIRRLDVEIVELAPPDAPRTGCGFAEIELQLDPSIKR